jgi:hypothetical protein
MKGILTVHVENAKASFDFTLRRNITIVRVKSASGKTTLCYMVVDYVRRGDQSGIRISSNHPCTSILSQDWEAELKKISNSIENDYKDPQFEFIHKKVDFEFSDGTLEEARNEAHELIDRVNAKKKKKYDDPLFFDDAFSFSTQVFDYHAVPSDLECVCDETRERTDQQYTTTIALLKTLWPERKFADEEIQLYRAIYRSWTTLVDQLGLLNECIDYMIGREDRFSIEKEQRRYKPFETSAPQAVSATKPVTSHAVYYKYIHEVRTHNVPFDYLHGTNIQATIKQIYEFVK